MFTFRITNLDQALRLIAEDWPTHVVSVMVPAHPPLSVPMLHLPFDDITRPAPGAVIPTMADVHAALAFTKDLVETDRLLVHCHSGLNRSTAIGIGILIRHGIAPAEAWQLIAAQRPAMAPNRLLLAYIDWHFSLAGTLSQLA